MASVLLAITTEAVLHSEYPAGSVVGVIDAVVGTVADVIEADAKAVVGGRRQGCRCGCYQGHRQGSR